MRYTTLTVCLLSVLALGLSIGTVAVSAPALSSVYVAAMEKLEPDLQKSLTDVMASSPNAEMRTIVFLTEDSDFSKARLELALGGARVSAEYSTLGIIATDIPAKSLLGLASSNQIERIFVDERRTLSPVPEGDWAEDYAKIYDQATGIWHASTPYVMGADKVWAEGITGAGVRVAVLDTGADLSQNDIASAIYDYKAFTGEEFHDADGHGTSTASLVASRAVNTYYGFIKMEGMAPGAMIMAGKVLGDDGYGWDSWIIGGIEWAVAGSDGDPMTDDGAQIISMSLGGLEVPNDGNDPSSLALDRAAQAGVASFVAAGNEGMGRGTIGSPGISKTTITVGASTNNAEAYYLLGYWPFTTAHGKYLASDYENNQMIWWSSRGPTADGRIDPDLAAVGAWGPAATPGNTIDLQFGGTSMATPVAAGIGALVYEAFMKTNDRAPTPAELKAILMGTAIDMGFGPTEQGAGRIDAYASYEAATGALQVGSITNLALTMAPGQTRTINLGGTVSSKVLEEMDGTSFMQSGSVQRNKDWFYSFKVPEGASYLHVDLAFDPVYLFSTDVHSFIGSGFTDDHLNLVLYKIENGARTMINYAYAHTNTQELNAQVSPGLYELRVWGAQYVNIKIPFDVGFEFYKTVPWSWANTNGPKATLKVPIDANAGTHVAYLEVSRAGLKSLVPVAITVPLKIGVPTKGIIDVNHEAYTSMEGDWVYYTVWVPSGAEALTSVLTWSDWDTCIEMYMIDPMRNVIDASMTPYLGNGLYGPWTTSTGTTAQVVTVEKPAAGRWMIGLHDTFLGMIFEEPYELVATLSSPVTFGASAVTVSPSATATLTNHLGYPGSVVLVPVKGEVDQTLDTYDGMLASTNIGGYGYDELLFDVAPGTVAIELSIVWASPTADIDVVVYASDGSNRGVLWESGDTLFISDPVSGTWEAAVAMRNPGQSTTYSLSLSTTAYPIWTALELSAYEIMMGPMGSAEVAISSTIEGAGTYSGMIVAYDMVTGCTYDRLAVTVVVS